MLVLSRGKGEKIIIGNGEIVLEVLEIKKDGVRIGIAAPKETQVHREEVWDKIKTAPRTP
jgi:carbon storage regulator